MKTAILLPIFGILALLNGCTSIANLKVPPGSLTSWHHIGNYGPFRTDVTIQDVTKLPDGSFVLGHYEGEATWMGFGPHDIIDGLHIDGSGTPVSTPAK